MGLRHPVLPVCKVKRLKGVCCSVDIDIRKSVERLEIQMCWDLDMRKSVQALKRVESLEIQTCWDLDMRKRVFSEHILFLKCIETYKGVLHVRCGG